MKNTKWLLYTFGIFMLAPLTLLLLYGFGTMISVFANPSALGPLIIPAFIIVILLALKTARRFIAKK